MKNYYRHQHLLLTSIVLLSLTMAMVIGCNKLSYRTDGITDPGLSKIKEWYYGNFKKSPEYKSINWSDPLLDDMKDKMSKDRQFIKHPYWSKTMIHKFGKQTIYEIPLSYENELFVFFGDNKYNSEEKNLIKKCRINRALFVINQDGSISKKIVTFLPSLKFLQANGYDISRINTRNFKENKFDGFLFVKKWDESFEKIYQWEDGKVKQLKVSVNKNANIYKPTNKSQMAAEQNCYFEPVLKCEVIGCVYVPIGDEPSPPCESLPSEQQSLDCHYEYEQVCQETNDPNICMGYPSEEECYCALYGMCSNDDGTSPDSETENCSDSETTLNEALTCNSASESVNIIPLSQTLNKREFMLQWIFVKHAYSLWYFVSHEHAYHKKVFGVWQWDKLTHENIEKMGGQFGVEINCTILDKIIEVGKFNSGIDLKYKVKGSFICNGVPLAMDWPSMSSKKIWNINDTK